MFRSDGTGFHVKCSVPNSHTGMETGTHHRDNICKLHFETCMDNQKEKKNPQFQAKPSAVSPAAFLSFHPWKIKAICVGQREFHF